MSRYRVLIRAFTCRRDAAYSEFLAGLLRRRGCEVIVASVRNFVPTLERWEPHGVVVNVPGQVARCRQRAPGARIVFLDGEGGEPLETSNARYFAVHRDDYDAADLVLVWGPEPRRFYDEVMPGVDHSRVRVIGNPKLDLVRFLPARARAGTGTVGVVGRFSQLNHHGGVATLRSLLGGALEEITNAARDFHHLCRAMEAVLGHTDARLSIRPYPNEAIETYQRYVQPHFGERVSIDDGLDFAGWAGRQRVLLSPASSSILEAYLLQVPVLSLSRIAGTREYAAERYPLAARLDALVPAPDSLEQLCELVQQPPQPRTEDPEIEQQLRDYHGWDLGGSANLRAAGHIVDMLDVSSPRTGIPWPRWLLERRDDVSFRRAMRANPLHANMNYKVGWHRLPACFDEMIDAAFAEVEVDA